MPEALIRVVTLKALMSIYNKDKECSSFVLFKMQVQKALSSQDNLKVRQVITYACRVLF